MPATLIKKRLWHRCFPVNFAPAVAAFVVRRNSKHEKDNRKKENLKKSRKNRVSCFNISIVEVEVGRW